MEEPSAEKLNELYLSLLKEYNLFYGSEEYVESMEWVDVPHIFESPFYVISYSVSASAALEIYELEQEDDGIGAELLVLMSESGLSGLEESLAYAGLSDDMLSESRVRHNAELLRGNIFGWSDGE